MYTFSSDFKKSFLVNISEDKVFISKYNVTNIESRYGDTFSFTSQPKICVVVTGELGKTNIIDRYKAIDITEDEIINLIEPLLQKE